MKKSKNFQNYITLIVKTKSFLFFKNNFKIKGKKVMKKELKILVVCGDYKYIYSYKTINEKYINIFRLNKFNEVKVYKKEIENSIENTLLKLLKEEINEYLEVVNYFSAFKLTINDFLIYRIE